MDPFRGYYERNLPHFQPSGYSFFVTFRLTETLPAEVIKNYKEIKKKRIETIAGYDNPTVRREKYQEFQIEYFKLYDDYMDKCISGHQWLKDNKLADIVKGSLHYRDGKEYDLISYTIMSNHVHLVFIPYEKSVSLETERSASPVSCSAQLYTELPPDKTSDFTESPYRVTKILQDMKKFTAGECNKVLNRSGKFWHHESYDHVVRNSDELKRIVNYVLNNPVKAGLVDYPEQWAYNYVNYDLIPVL